MSNTLHGSIFITADATAVAGFGRTGPSLTFGTVSLFFVDLYRHELAAELRRLADDLGGAADPDPAPRGPLGSRPAGAA